MHQGSTFHGEKVTVPSLSWGNGLSAEASLGTLYVDPVFKSCCVKEARLQKGQPFHRMPRPSSICLGFRLGG